MKNKYFLLVIVLFLSTACLKETGEPDTHTRAQNDLVMATLYSQYAQEYRALAYQAFNVARISIDNTLKENNGKKLAVIVDIDETVLDNTPYQAWSIVKNTGYPQCWNEWCNLAEAKAVPGAVEFLDYTVSKGVDVFYVSNRKEKFVYNATLKNLENVGFPQVSAEHLMLRTESSDKQSRRDKITEMGYEIALLVGDNLGDFYSDSHSDSERTAQVEEYKNQFGSKYIVLPNAMYGNWPSAIGATSPAKIDSLLKVSIKGLESVCEQK